MEGCQKRILHPSNGTYCANPDVSTWMNVVWWEMWKIFVLWEFHDICVNLGGMRLIQISVSWINLGPQLLHKLWWIPISLLDTAKFEVCFIKDGSITRMPALNGPVFKDLKAYYNWKMQGYKNILSYFVISLGPKMFLNVLFWWKVLIKEVVLSCNVYNNFWKALSRTGLSGCNGCYFV